MTFYSAINLPTTDFHFRRVSASAKIKRRQQCTPQTLPFSAKNLVGYQTAHLNNCRLRQMEPSVIATIVTERSQAKLYHRSNVAHTDQQSSLRPIERPQPPHRPCQSHCYRLA
jgi:hypothetical protein